MTHVQLDGNLYQAEPYAFKPIANDDRWINVGEKLPEENIEVLMQCLCAKQGTRYLKIGSHSQDKWCDLSASDDKVMYWMYIPNYK